MPRSKPFPDLIQELRSLLTDDLAGAFRLLLVLLPAGSEKHQSATVLLGKLNDTNKASLRGTLSNENLQLAYNQLRSDLLDLIEALTEADFDPAAPAPAPQPAKQGEILYRIPDAMPLGRETRCTVRIALDADDIVENITLDEHVTLKPLARVSELMQVELLDPGRASTFFIRSISSPEQLVEDEGYTEWLFWVTPLQAGTFPLLIKVSVIELLMGKERKKELVLEETIRISADAEARETPEKSAGPALVFQAGTEPPGRNIPPPGAPPEAEQVEEMVMPQPAAPAPIRVPASQAPESSAPPLSPIYTPPQQTAAPKQRQGMCLWIAAALVLLALVALIWLRCQ